MDNWRQARGALLQAKAAFLAREHELQASLERCDDEARARTRALQQQLQEVFKPIQLGLLAVQQVHIGLTERIVCAAGSRSPGSRQNICRG